MHKDHENMAFNFNYGLYRFQRIPFRFRNAPGTLHGYMDVITSSIQGKFALVHPNDIVFFSKTQEQHIEQVCSVLSHLKKAEVALKLEECQFFT